MGGHRGTTKTGMSTGKKLGIGAAVVVCAPPLIIGMISGAKQSLGSHPAAAASSTPIAPATRSTTSSKHPARTRPTKAAPAPTWVYPGDKECAITYASNANGGTTWTATTTVGGEIKTDDTNTWPGDNTPPSTGLDTRDVHVSAGQTPFSTDAPLSSVTDISGVLYVPTEANPTTSYSCSIAPAPKGTGGGSFATTTGIGEIMSPSGRYYNAGDSCPSSDAGKNTITDQGRTITCTLESSQYRWH
jgi:hypothetical protein